MVAPLTQKVNKNKTGGTPDTESKETEREQYLEQEARGNSDEGTPDTKARSNGSGGPPDTRSNKGM